MTCAVAGPNLCRFLTPEWQTAFWTAAACASALAIALFGKSMSGWFYHPILNLGAVVRRPEAERVGRMQKVGPVIRMIGEAWFFRLAISNDSDTPARDVQVYLKRVERGDGANVDRFSPINLKWTHVGETTRKVLLRGVPVFCDFIHIGDPTFRLESGEDLPAVPIGQGILCLDVAATNTGMGHLLEPGAYRFHLVLAAENSRARNYVVEVRYNGTWFMQQDQMFDEEVGFRMKKGAGPPSLLSFSRRNSK